MELSASATERIPAAEEQLWRAVIASTIREWISGPLRRKCEAEQYLFQDETDFPVVCQSAGIDIELLRSRLGRLRKTGVLSELGSAPANFSRPR